MNTDEDESLDTARRYTPPRGDYKGLELRPYQGRPGAMTAFDLPSRMGQTLRYRDGTVQEVKQ